MSNSHDPVTVILDKVQEWKGEADNVISSSITTVMESSFYRSIQQVLARTQSSGISLPSSSRVLPPPPPPSVYSKCTDWITSHKIIAGLIALGLTSGTVYYIYTINGINYLRPPQRRRAKRAVNNARKEVVLIAGSPAEPITRVIASDLNKRGFIVYWTTSSPDEEAIVQRENSPDIRKLPLNISEASSIEECTAILDNVLTTPVTAFPGAVPHELILSGILVVPDLYYPSGPIESVRVDTWSDLLYSKLLGPIFLLSNGLIDLVRRHKSRIIILSPSIMGTLNPGFHAPESITSNAIDSLALCLHRELSPQQIPVVQLKLGSFDVSHGRPQERQIANSVRADILSWSQKLRSLYSRQYQASAYLQTTRAYGSNLRVLHYAVFDALTTSRPSRVSYVGRGSYAYSFLSRWLPESMMSWLLQPPSTNIYSHVPETVDKDWETV